MRVAGLILGTLIVIVLLFALGPQVAANIVIAIAQWVASFFGEIFKEISK